MLVGRDAEMEALERLLGETCSGGSHAVFLSGEPGIGKTYVLADLVRRAEARVRLVLEGSAAEFEQELPFGVVIDALDAYLESLGRPVADRLAADGLVMLADVFPSLRALRVAGQPPLAAGERFRAYYAVRELLERLAAKQPLVLILDDLHWADGASLELVAHLLRRPPDAPVLLAGAFRVGQVGPALAVAIDNAERSGLVERLRLQPLTPEDAGRLVGGDAATRARLYGQSGGNPFYLMQLARAGAAPGPSRARSDADANVAPPAVAAAIAHEVAALSASARAFLGAAAVAGDPFDLELSASAAGVEEPAALDAIDALIARDLVRPAQVPRRFHFRHPLVRNAVYQAASTGTRLAAHARCAAALAARGVPASMRAHHVEQSARQGDAAAIAVLLEAGRENVHRLPSSAARWFEAARRLLPDTAAPEERVTVMEAEAAALSAGGRRVEARATLVAAIDLVPLEAVDRRLKLTAACAAVEQQLGRHEESHARLQRALDELTDRHSEHGVALMVALATDGFYQMDYPAMEDWAASALAAASDLGDRTLRAAAEAIVAFGCSFTGATDRADAHARTAATLIDAMPDEELLGCIDAVAHLAAAELYIERFDETARHARRGITLAHQLGQGEVYPTLAPCLGTAAWVGGNLRESAEVLDTAVEAARLSGNDQGLAWSLLNRSLSALMAGDLEDGLELGAESQRLAGGLGDSFVASLAGIILGWMTFENGDPAAGAELIVRCGGGDTVPLVPGGWRATYLEVLTRCWLALGRPDDARRAAQEARCVADQVSLPRTEAMARLAAAAVALHDGESRRAVEEAQMAVLAAEKASAHIDAATARIVLGRALAQAGEPSLAITELEQAATAFDGFGAPRWRDRAEHELRKLGRRVHRRTAPGKAHGEGLETLSGRELEVARLVVDRRTNAEIASDLFLSLKTVESHMRNIFRKLGVSSRAEVARVLERASGG